MIRSICKYTIASVVFLVWCLPSLAADYYVAGYATWTSANPVGNDSTGNGSSATPYATLAKVTAAHTLAAGDRIHLAGIVFSAPAAPFVINNVDNVTVRQWSGATQGHVHGGVRAALSGWTRSTNRYNLTIGASKVIAGVTLNYDSAVDANGMKRAWLNNVADAATCGTTDYSWYYDSVGGVLYVNTASATTSLVAGGTDSVTYVDLSGGTTATTGNLNGVYVQDSDYPLISGLIFSGFIGQKATTTYYTNGVQFYTVNYGVVENCTFYDNGIHSISIAGLSCIGNKILNCAGYGLWTRSGSGADGGNHFVFYSGGTNVYDCVGAGLTAVCSSILDPTGAEVDTSMVCGGYYSHTDGAGGRIVSDVEWVRCTLLAINGECQPPFSVANITVPSDGTKYQNYPARATDCTITATDAKLTFGTPFAFRRCRFDITPPAADVNLTGYQHTAGSSGYVTLHESCDFTSRHGTNAFYQAFTSAANWTHYLYNCSFLLTRTTTTEGYFFAYLNAAGNTISARNCVFSDASSSGTVYLCVSDGAISAARHDFKNCSYFNIDDANYSVNATFNAKAEWISAVDTASADSDPWFPTVQPFNSITSASHDLNRLSGVWRFPRRYFPFSIRGINGFSNSGHLGAWQYGVQSRTDSAGLRGGRTGGRYIRD